MLLLGYLWRLRRGGSGLYTEIIYVPALVLLELSFAVHDEEIKLSKPFAEWVDDLFRYRGFIEYALDAAIVKRFHYQTFHNDPFDRAIVCTALHLGIPLITNDRLIHEKRPCEIYWD